MFLLDKSYFKIKKTKEKGLGIFADKKISAGTIIGDYIGKMIKNADYDLKNDAHGLYLMYLTDEASIYPDLKKHGIHLFNHSCTPNCWMYIYRGHTLFFALRNIEPNEELTISYLLSPKDEICNPCTHICKCESKNCIGTFHLPKEKYKWWQQFQENTKKVSKIKFKYGRSLPTLETYPKKIPNYKAYIKNLIQNMF